MHGANHLLGPNYLEFLEHTRSVARLLLQKAGAQNQRHEDIKFVCVDLDREKFSVLDGVGSRPREILFVRELTWLPYEHKDVETKKLHG